jgi:hypothetical protein
LLELPFLYLKIVRQHGRVAGKTSDAAVGVLKYDDVKLPAASRNLSVMKNFFTFIGEVSHFGPKGLVDAFRPPFEWEFFLIQIEEIGWAVTTPDLNGWFGTRDCTVDASAGHAGAVRCKSDDPDPAIGIVFQ